MSWIRTIPPAEATGALKTEYDAATRRAGKVFNIIRAQSLNPPALHASVELYKTLMHGPSSLSRPQREMIAMVVARAMDCFY